MERRTFVFDLKAGMEQEYIRRHRQIWPEMLAMLKEAGIRNYSIWLWNSQVIGYYESENLSVTDAFKAQSPVQAKWSAYMQDILLPAVRGGIPLPAPDCVFYME